MEDMLRHARQLSFKLYLDAVSLLAALSADGSSAQTGGWIGDPNNFDKSPGCAKDE
jgi:hypothetical protein